jgi:hypothetical protein
MTSHQEPPLGPRLAFAPLHKRALGTAFGVAAGLATFVTTAMLLRDPQRVRPRLLAQFYRLFRVVPGAIIGAAWLASRASCWDGSSRWYAISWSP